MDFMQRTIARSVTCSGIGLHTGQPVNLTICPAEADEGVTFIRTDLSGQPAIPARTDYVVNTVLSTTIGRNGAQVSTVEHLMAALAGTGIDNAQILINGPEVPAMDGSAAEFVAHLREAGSRSQPRPRRYLLVRRPLGLADDDRRVQISPSDRLRISCTIEFDHPAVSTQSLDLTFSDRSFVRDISPARTFGFLEDVATLKANGLALGGSLNNAVVMDTNKVLNQEGLRFKDEFVRHKVLDFIGDLALIGRPVIGHFRIHKSGHALHHRLAELLQGSPHVQEAVLTTPEEARDHHVQVPTFGLIKACAA
ncbi:MAG: UDP-3-O-acyl-N-acetylglucosamine deacetylase [Proteobacteria bacterium]|nr:UDP-3-O-acyl-N-acetylglucosamine deacetylase [Pseudomonadota bacterium]MBU1742036.1 UDP-3-O-acyl-N-acetylglucosamine deacetylase [Pseudomonadota bacterium]